MAKPTLPDPKLPWAIPLKAVYLIAVNEGCRLKAYKCPAGVWTIFYGETQNVFEGETGTQAEADMTLCQSIRRYAAAVEKMCKIAPNENELGALVSLSYNIGLAGLQKSSVMSAHNRGDRAAAARAFAAWNKYRDPKTKLMTVSTGLTRRRAEEASLYLTPVAEAAHDDAPVVAAAPMPQAVAAPATPAKHPVSIAGILATGTGALGTLNELSTQASSVTSTAQAVATNAQATVGNVQTAASTAHGIVQTIAGFVGVTPGMFACIAITAIGAAALAYAYKLHKDGRL